MSCRACARRPLRHRIRIEAEQPTGDGAGGQGDPWAAPRVVAQAWAAVEPLRGSEGLRAQQLEDKVTHRITTRYRPGITASMRIVFRTRTFNIRSVINVEEADRFLEILAEEGVAL